MSKIRKINLHIDDLSKLKKYGTLRVDNYVIKVDDVSVKQIKVFGELEV